MSQFRVAKQRVEAELTLATGDRLVGSFFLAGGSATHDGPERVVDLLNCEDGFFPFETSGPDDTVLVNRSHLVAVRLLATAEEARLITGYDIALVRHVVLRLTTRTVVRGTIRVYRPEGRDRLSDYTRSPERFRYLENADGTFIINSAHIVELSETLS